MRRHDSVGKARTIALRSLFASVGTALCLSLAAPASAQFAGVEFTAPPTVNINGTWDMGYTFDVTAPLAVIALGVFDNGAAPLLNSHTVGLFTASGTLLASAVVSNADSIIGNFRYHNLAAPVPLPVGSYVVLAMNWGGTSDPWADTGGAAWTMAPGVANVARTFRPTTGTLDTAGLSQGCCSTSGYFGGNVLLGAPQAASVPALEPNALALLGAIVAFAAISVLWRRRQANRP